MKNKADPEDNARAKAHNPGKPANLTTVTDWLDWLEQDPSFDRTRRSAGKTLVEAGLLRRS